MSWATAPPELSSEIISSEQTAAPAPALLLWNIQQYNNNKQQLQWWEMTSECQSKTAGHVNYILLRGSNLQPRVIDRMGDLSFYQGLTLLHDWVLSLLSRSKNNKVNSCSPWLESPITELAMFICRFQDADRLRGREGEGGGERSSLSVSRWSQASSIISQFVNTVAAARQLTSVSIKICPGSSREKITQTSPDWETSDIISCLAAQTY